jgi:hypothetical protein
VHGPGWQERGNILDSDTPSPCGVTKRVPGCSAVAVLCAGAPEKAEKIRRQIHVSYLL